MIEQAPPPPPPRYLTPAELLAAWEALAKVGVPGAALRVEMLRRQAEPPPDA